MNWIDWLTLRSDFDRFRQVLARPRITRLEETADRMFRIAAGLRTAGADDAPSTRLAIAAANAAWDLRRRLGLEETP